MRRADPASAPLTEVTRRRCRQRWSASGSTEAPEIADGQQRAIYDDHCRRGRPPHGLSAKQSIPDGQRKRLQASPRETLTWD